MRLKTILTPGPLDNPILHHRDIQFFNPSKTTSFKSCSYLHGNQFSNLFGKFPYLFYGNTQKNEKCGYFHITSYQDLNSTISRRTRRGRDFCLPNASGRIATNSTNRRILPLKPIVSTKNSIFFEKSAFSLLFRPVTTPRAETARITTDSGCAALRAIVKGRPIRP